MAEKLADSGWIELTYVGTYHSEIGFYSFVDLGGEVFIKLCIPGTPETDYANDSIIYIPATAISFTYKTEAEIRARLRERRDICYCGQSRSSHSEQSNCKQFEGRR